MAALEAMESYYNSHVQAHQKVLKNISCQVTESGNTTEDMQLDYKLHWVFSFSGKSAACSYGSNETQTDKIVFETLWPSHCNGVTSNGIHYPPPSSLSSQVGCTFMKLILTISLMFRNYLSLLKVWQLKKIVV